jgi:AmmeMemoRadiSam system protein B
VILQQFDGTRTTAEIASALGSEFQITVDPELVSELARQLDEAGFIESDRFAALKAERNRTFRSLPMRRAAFAGVSYASTAEVLSRELDERFADVVRARQAESEPPGRVRDHADPPSGVIAPHIDLRVADDTYAHAYKCFFGARRRPDLFVIFGTAHALVTEPFVATRVGYDTPLGPVPTASDFVDAVAVRYGGDLFADEAVHEREHSIEFQAVHLRYLFGVDVPPIVPILCGTLEGDERGEVDRDRGVLAERLLSAIRGAAIERGWRVCVIAGADLAHLGPRFEDEESPLDSASLELLEAEDRVTLGHVERGDARRFFRSVSHDGNRRRICGLTPIYMTMKWAGGAPGVVHRYHQWLEDGSVVSFAAATIEA